MFRTAVFWTSFLYKTCHLTVHIYGEKLSWSLHCVILSQRRIARWPSSLSHPGSVRSSSRWCHLGESRRTSPPHYLYRNSVQSLKVHTTYDHLIIFTFPKWRCIVQIEKKSRDVLHSYMLYLQRVKSRRAVIYARLLHFFMIVNYQAT